MITVKNKKVVVLGAARSGLAVAELLTEKEADVFVSDIAPEESKKDEIAILKKKQIQYEFGKHSNKIYNSDLVVISPGVFLTAEKIELYQKLKIPVYSELEVSSWFCKSSIIAITGSNGKTTTVSLLGDMIKNEMPQSIVAGNIGIPFSSKINQSSEKAWAIIEVSSFQLEMIDTFHPQIAIILNLSPNHLDRYNSYEDYADAKIRVIKNLTHNDYLIYNRDNSLLKQKIKNWPAKKLGFSKSNLKADAYIKENQLYLFNKKLICCDDIVLQGTHNYMNAMAAALGAYCTGITSFSINKALTNFKGVEHRLEYIEQINGVDFINDSKATTIESLEVALTSFSRPVILIAGGKDKGSDYSRINKVLKDKTKAIILIGEAQEKMASSWDSLHIPIFMQNSLKDAVEKACAFATYNDIVLLSPACASFDMFRDFEDRGRKFKQLVFQLKNSVKEYEKTEK